MTKAASTRFACLDPQPLRWLSFRRCPAFQRGTCRRPYEGGELCQTFVCSQCGYRVPWCFGGTEDERCDACWSKQL